MRLAILSDYQSVALTSADWSGIAERADIDVFTEPMLGLEDAASKLQDYEIVCIMRERVPFPRTLMERLPKLKLIASTGTPNNSIDTKAAEELGIVVTSTQNGPGYIATAELAWALLLDLNRHVTAEHNAVRQGRWQTTIGRTLAGQKLGIVGLGNIGSIVARYAQAFGMEIVTWSPSMTQDRAARSGARCVQLDELLEMADAVTIHLPLNAGTRGLIDSRLIGRMKRSAILVNTSRGPIVDEDALVEALKSRRIAGAGLDVFDVEPLAANHPFRTLDNILITPHIGFVTDAVYQIFYQGVVAEVEKFLDRNS